MFFESLEDRRLFSVVGTNLQTAITSTKLLTTVTPVSVSPTASAGLIHVVSPVQVVLPPTPVLSNGVLTINGTSGNDTIDVTAYGFYGATVTVNGSTWTYAFVDSVVINSLDGNDHITTENSVELPVTIRAGNGDDTVFAGGTQVTVELGSGTDTATAGNGYSDEIIGGSGSDHLYGGDAATCYLRGDNCTGTAYLYAGSGTDYLHGSTKATNYLYGGTGTDSLYGAGTGTSYLTAGSGTQNMYGGPGVNIMKGGSGTDTFVALGTSNHDTIQGGTGVNSYWVDSESTEQVIASASDVSAGRVHRISGFMGGVSRQLFSSTPLTEPNAVFAGDIYRPACAHPTYVDFSSDPLFPDAPTPDDINQQTAGDCYFMAGLAETALRDPNAITNSVVALGDNTYAVEFHQGSTISYVRVDGELPVDASGALLYADTGVNSAIWVPIIEKAFVEWRANSNNSYAGIYGGSGMEAFSALGATGEQKSTPTSSSLNGIVSALASGKSVVVGTIASGLPASTKIMPNHDYTVLSATSSTITLRNPHGKDTTSQFSEVITVSMSDFLKYFNEVDVAAI